jgi:hypothetical protein
MNLKTVKDNVFIRLSLKLKRFKKLRVQTPMQRIPWLRLAVRQQVEWALMEIKMINLVKEPHYRLVHHQEDVYLKARQGRLVRKLIVQSMIAYPPQPQWQLLPKRWQIMINWHLMLSQLWSAIHHQVTHIIPKCRLIQFTLDSQKRAKECWPSKQPSVWQLMIRGLLLKQQLANSTCQVIPVTAPRQDLTRLD